MYLTEYTKERVKAVCFYGKRDRVQLYSLDQMTELARVITGTSSDEVKWSFRTDKGDLSLGNLSCDHVSVRAGDCPFDVNATSVCGVHSIKPTPPRPMKKTKRPRANGSAKKKNTEVHDPTTIVDDGGEPWDVDKVPGMNKSQLCLLKCNEWDYVHVRDMLQENIPLPLKYITSHLGDTHYECTFVKPDGTFLADMNMAMSLINRMYPSMTEEYWKRIAA